MHVYTTHTIGVSDGRNSTTDYAHGIPFEMTPSMPKQANPNCVEIDSGV